MRWPRPANSSCGNRSNVSRVSWIDALSWPLLRGIGAQEDAGAGACPRASRTLSLPFAIIDLWSKHGAQGDAAYEAEARSIAGLMVGDTSRNLVRVFLLQDRLKGLGSKDRSDVKIARVHVVGAGVMGGDIAALCAQRGLNVTLQDRELKYIEPALKRLAKVSRSACGTRPRPANSWRASRPTWRAMVSPAPMSSSRPFSRTPTPSTSCSRASNRA